MTGWQAGHMSSNRWGFADCRPGRKSAFAAIPAHRRRPGLAPVCRISAADAGVHHPDIAALPYSSVPQDGNTAMARFRESNRCERSKTWAAHRRSRERKVHLHPRPREDRADRSCSPAPILPQMIDSYGTAVCAGKTCQLRHFSSGSKMDTGKQRFKTWRMQRDGVFDDALLKLAPSPLSPRVSLSDRKWRNVPEDAISWYSAELQKGAISQC